MRDFSETTFPTGGFSVLPSKGTTRFNAAAGAVDRDTFYGLATDKDDVKGDRVTARLERDISDNFTITNQTVWEQAEREARYTIPYGYIAPSVGFPNGQARTDRQYYDRVNETFSNQTNLAGTFVAGGLKHTVSSGVEFTRETSDALRFPNAGQTGNADIYNPDPHRPYANFADPTQRNSVEIRTAAAYFYDTVQLTRQLELVGGLRVEHYDYEIDSRNIAGAPIGSGSVEGGGNERSAARSAWFTSLRAKERFMLRTAGLRFRRAPIFPTRTSRAKATTLPLPSSQAQIR